MKNRILAIALLQFLLLLSGCSGPDSEPAVLPEENGVIKADYINWDNVYDFVIGTDNILYTIGQSEDEKGLLCMGLKRIDLDGKETRLHNLNIDAYNFAQLALANNGELLVVSKGNESANQDKIMHFENNFSELKPFYTMKPISSPFASKINLLSICNNNDNTYFVFDYNARNIKRVIPDLNGDVFVAGSGKNEIQDGSGLNASFGTIRKIVSLNSVLYLIDEIYDSSTGTFKKSAIRKLEYVNNEWKVTTLVLTTNGDSFSDLTFDTKNNLYVINSGKGIYKLNLENNNLSLFYSGDLKIKAGTKRINTGFESVSMVKFKGNDIYLKFSTEIVKISDFQTKFAAVGK